MAQPADRVEGAKKSFEMRLHDLRVGRGDCSELWDASHLSMREVEERRKNRQRHYGDLCTAVLSPPHHTLREMKCSSSGTPLVLGSQGRERDLAVQTSASARSGNALAELRARSHAAKDEIETSQHLVSTNPSAVSQKESHGAEVNSSHSSGDKQSSLICRIGSPSKTQKRRSRRYSESHPALDSDSDSKFVDLEDTSPQLVMLKNGEGSRSKAGGSRSLWEQRSSLSSCASGGGVTNLGSVCGVPKQPCSVNEEDREPERSNSGETSPESPAVKQRSNPETCEHNSCFGVSERKAPVFHLGLGKVETQGRCAPPKRVIAEEEQLAGATQSSPAAMSSSRDTRRDENEPPLTSSKGTIEAQKGDLNNESGRTGLLSGESARAAPAARVTLDLSRANRAKVDAECTRLFEREVGRSGTRLPGKPIGLGQPEAKEGGLARVNRCVDVKLNASFDASSGANTRTSSVSGSSTNPSTKAKQRSFRQGLASKTGRGSSLTRKTSALTLDSPNVKGSRGSTAGCKESFLTSAKSVDLSNRSKATLGSVPARNHDGAPNSTPSSFVPSAALKSTESWIRRTGRALDAADVTGPKASESTADPSLSSTVPRSRPIGQSRTRPALPAKEGGCNTRERSLQRKNSSSNVLQQGCSDTSKGVKAASRSTVGFPVRSNSQTRHPLAQVMPPAQSQRISSQTRRSAATGSVEIKDSGTFAARLDKRPRPTHACAATLCLVCSKSDVSCESKEKTAEQLTGEPCETDDPAEVSDENRSTLMQKRFRACTEKESKEAGKAESLGEALNNTQANQQQRSSGFSAEPTHVHRGLATIEEKLEAVIAALGTVQKSLAELHGKVTELSLRRSEDSKQPYSSRPQSQPAPSLSITQLAEVATAYGLQLTTNPGEANPTPRGVLCKTLSEGAAMASPSLSYQQFGNPRTRVPPRSPQVSSPLVLPCRPTLQGAPRPAWMPNYGSEVARANVPGTSSNTPSYVRTRVVGRGTGGPAPTGVATSLTESYFRGGSAQLRASVNATPCSFALSDSLAFSEAQIDPQTGTRGGLNQSTFGPSGEQFFLSVSRGPDPYTSGGRGTEATTAECTCTAGTTTASMKANQDVSGEKSRALKVCVPDLNESMREDNSEGLVKLSSGESLASAEGGKKRSKGGNHFGTTTWGHAATTLGDIAAALDKPINETYGEVHTLKSGSGGSSAATTTTTEANQVFGCNTADSRRIETPSLGRKLVDATLLGKSTHRSLECSDLESTRTAEICDDVMFVAQSVMASTKHSQQSNKEA